MWPRAWLTRTDGRQATSADWLRAGIEGSGCGAQDKIVMSWSGLQGRAGTSNAA